MQHINTSPHPLGADLSGKINASPRLGAVASMWERCESCSLSSGSLLVGFASAPSGGTSPFRSNAVAELNPGPNKRDEMCTVDSPPTRLGHRQQFESHQQALLA